MATNMEHGGALPPGWERVDGKIKRKKKYLTDTGPFLDPGFTSETDRKLEETLKEKAPKSPPYRKLKSKEKKVAKRSKVNLVDKIGDEIALPKDDLPNKVKKSKKSKAKKSKRSLRSRLKKAFTRMSVKEKRAKEKPDDFKKASPSTADLYRKPVSQNKYSKNIKSKAVVEKTKAGDYPVYKKKSVTASSFRDAFSQARGDGKKVFTWQGRKYSTRQKGEGSWNAETGKWSKKKIGGGFQRPPKDPGLIGTGIGVGREDGGEIPAGPKFKKGIKYYEHGGQTSEPNEKAASGDVVNTYSHSGYKAGK